MVSGHKEVRSDGRLASGIADIVQGICLWRLWLLVGWYDIHQKYRRSVIGPLWITLSLGIFIFALAVVYSGLFGQEMGSYLPYVGSGFIIWNLISNLNNEGATCFLANAAAVKNMNVPLTVYCLRIVFRNIIIMLHNMVIFIIMIFLLNIDVNYYTFLFFPAMFFIIINGVSYGLAFGSLSTRFRDIPLIMTNILQVLFFITPVLWKPEALPANQWWVTVFNPMFHLVMIARAPMLGQPPDLLNWGVVGVVTFLHVCIATLVFARVRTRIAYWL